MKRISNLASLRMQIGWPFFTFGLLIFAIYQIQQNSASAPQFVIIVAAVVVARRFFSRDAYEVLEGEGGLIVKKGRLAVAVSYEQITKIEVKGGRLEVTTSEPQMSSFTFLPANTSFLSTGASRREALTVAANELNARIQTQASKPD